MINAELLQSLYPLPMEDFEPYLTSVDPPLTPEELQANLLLWAERSGLHTPTTGDMTLMLWYKQLEGFATSFGLTDTDMQLLQLQGGASRKSFRVAQGLQTASFAADQTWRMATHPESGVLRVTMPYVYDIDGIMDAALETAPQRYIGFASRLGMLWSDEENQYICDLY